jgi:hypothetical protein
VVGSDTPFVTPQGPGWYPDPQRHAEYRWWDGERWTEQVADHGVAHADRSLVAPGVVSAAAFVGGWQVVDGPSLPMFGSVAARSGAWGGVSRVLGRPAIATAVVAAAAIVPALLSDVGDVRAVLPLRIGVSVLAVAVAAAARRLPARFGMVAVVVPLLFAVVSGVAAVPVFGGWRDGALGALTALPFLVSAVAGVVVGARNALVARRAGRGQARATS